MNGGSSCAEGGYGVLHTKLGQPHDIHVTLYDKHPTCRPNGIRRVAKTIDFLAFFEQRSFGRVQVLRLALPEDSATESDHHVASTKDPEHHAVSKTIVTPTLVPLAP